MKQIKASIIVDKITFVRLVDSRNDYTVEKRTKKRLFGENITGFGHDYETVEEYISRFDNDPEFKNFIHYEDKILIKYKPKVVGTLQYFDGKEVKRENIISFFDNIILAQEYYEKAKETQVKINSIPGRTMVEVEDDNNIVILKK